ncbi:tetratricopeptide repeat protein, partial [bacterium]
MAGATADRLDSLVQKSLVQFSPAGRYRLLETVREYACERLDDGGEKVATEIRHLEFFAELAEGLEDSTEAMREFEREGENFRAGLDRGGRAPQTALRLAAALGPCWDTVVTLREGADRLEAALAGADPGPTEARAKALHYLGHMHFSTDRAAAVRSYEASLSVWRGLGDKAGIARSLHSLGVAAFFAGDLLEGKRHLAESLSFARAAGDPRFVAYALGAMAQLSLQEGDYRSAEAVAEESLTIFRAIGKPQEIGWGIRTLGLLAHDMSDYPKMRACNEEARALFEKDGAAEGVAWCLKDLGTAASELGQLALGFDLLDQAY